MPRTKQYRRPSLRQVTALVRRNHATLSLLGLSLRVRLSWLPDDGHYLAPASTARVRKRHELIGARAGELDCVAVARRLMTFARAEGRLR